MRWSMHWFPNSNDAMSTTDASVMECIDKTLTEMLLAKNIDSNDLYRAEFFRNYF